MEWGFHHSLHFFLDEIRKVLFWFVHMEQNCGCLFGKSACWRNFIFFMKDAAVLVQETITALFQQKFDEVYPTEPELVRGNIIAALRLDRDVTFLYIWTLLWKTQALACHVFFCACHSLLEGRNIPLHRQWNCHCSFLTAIIPTLFSLHVG